MHVRGFPDSSDTCWTVTVSGDVDLATAGAIRRETTGPDARSRPHVLIDLSETTFCDCAGLGSLIDARQAAMDRGATLTIVHPTEAVRRLLALTGTEWLTTSGAGPAGRRHLVQPRRRTGRTRLLHQRMKV